MGTLTSLFNLARGSLTSDQAALNVVSNNVANQNTAGYTREVVRWNSADSVSLSGAPGGGNPGIAPTISVTSQRDRVLEQRVQQQAQTQASTSARSDVLGQIENIFNISGSSTTAGSTPIGTDLNSFFSSVSSLASAPSDSATRQAVLSAANTLATDFNAGASQLLQITRGLNSSVATSVGAVNGLTDTIAQLNRQIGSTSPGGDAGALEDQRQNAIAQLSQYIGLDQVRTDGNGITLETTSGVPLVLGDKSFALSTATVGGTAQILDSSGTNVSAGISGGSLGGQLLALTEDIPQVRNSLDAVAFRVASAVNTQNAAGLTPAGVNGGPIFSIPASAAGSAATISVVAAGPSDLATAGPGEGSSGNTNAVALAAISQATDASGATINLVYAGMISNVGNTSAGLSEQNTVQQASLTQLTTQRNSLSTVSLDEEAANLTQYQKSYDAAAKLFSIINTLMSSAINLGTQTTVN